MAAPCWRRCNQWRLDGPLTAGQRRSQGVAWPRVAAARQGAPRAIRILGTQHCVQLQLVQSGLPASSRAGTGMGVVLLCRHAQSMGTSTESGLTATGEGEAAELAAWIAAPPVELPPVRNVLCSTFSRAIDTASPVAAAVGLTVEQRSELCEWNIPRLQGDRWQDQVHALLDGTVTRSEIDDSVGPSREVAIAQLGKVVVNDGALQGTAVLVSHGKLMALWLGEQLGTPASQIWRHLGKTCVLALQPPVVGTSPAIRALRNCPPITELCGETIGAENSTYPCALRARPAEAADYELLWHVHVSCMKDVVTQVYGWDEDWQRNNFEARFLKSVGDGGLIHPTNPAGGTRLVLEVGGRTADAGEGKTFIWQPAGHVHVERLRNDAQQISSIELHNLQVLPACQGRGIGTYILRELQREARARNCPLNLQTHLLNVRARRLYHRVAFESTEETETHVKLRWSPDRHKI